MSAPVVLRRQLVPSPWVERALLLGGRTFLGFENPVTTEYTTYAYGPTGPFKTADAARWAFVLDLLENRIHDE